MERDKITRTFQKLMKQVFFIAMLTALVLLSCNEKPKNQVSALDIVANEVLDTAAYGVCADGTSMHSLVLLTDDDETLTLNIDADEDSACVLGGLMNGDRLTATYYKTADGYLATKVINVTTMMGKWTSLDKNFEMYEDGSIKSNVSAESKSYTAWTMCNGNLILNTDTFAVLELGADSMMLENSKGIFVYKRQK